MQENMDQKNSKNGHFSRSATLSSGHQILSRLHLKDCQRQKIVRDMCQGLFFNKKADLSL